MTQLMAELTRLHIDTRASLIAASLVSMIFGLFGTWSFWRVRRLLAALPSIEDRVAGLSHSVSLLTDTTEACFKAMALQLESMRQGSERSTLRRPGTEPGAPGTTAAKNRQRRVVGAARRGEPVSRIAAREQMAEGEVALRLQGSEPENNGQSKRYGNLFS